MTTSTGASRTVWLDGVFLPAAEARVSVDDRGFLFGDGAYEVVRVVRGAMFEAERHLRRLDRTLQGIGIGYGRAMELREVAERLLDENRLREDEATVYVQVTRGAASPRTHHFPPAGTRPTAYASAAPFVPFDALRARGAAVVTVPDIRWARCDLKTVNLLPNTLAKQRAVEAGAAEAVFVRDGIVTEGASSNVWGVVRGVLRTHPMTPAILAGVTREVVLEVARERGLPVEEVPLFLEEVRGLEECFLCSTTLDVMPVVSVDGEPVRGGSPGPVARLLQEGLRERMDTGVLAAPR
jgi:D-alanine transaminase